MDFPYTIFPPTRFASPLIVCAPVRYVPLAIVWSDVVGVNVAAALVVIDAVSETELFPAVPVDTYPADTVGVLETDFESVSVFVPLDTLAPVAEIGAAGDALPLAIVFVALLA